MTQRAGRERIGGELVRIDVRLGQHHPEDCGDQHEIGTRQRDIGNPAEVSLGLEDVCTATKPATTCSITIAPTSSIFSENHSWNVACRKMSAVPLPMARKAAGEVIAR